MSAWNARNDAVKTGDRAEAWLAQTRAGAHRTGERTLETSTHVTEGLARGAQFDERRFATGDPPPHVASLAWGLFQTRADVHAPLGATALDDLGVVSVS